MGRDGVNAADQLAHAMSEDQLLDAVIEFAEWHHWLVDHPRPARTKAGWATPLQGDAGRPDLLMAHPTGRVITAELKSEIGRLSEAQKRWNEALAAAGRRAAVASRTEDMVYAHFIWRPSDWLNGTIRGVLAR
jgi:hypothetical protein